MSSQNEKERVKFNWKNILEIAIKMDKYNAPKNQDNFSNNLISSSPVTLSHIF